MICQIPSLMLGSWVVSINYIWQVFLVCSGLECEGTQVLFKHRLELLPA